jgi:hypothetical protein
MPWTPGAKPLRYDASARELDMPSHEYRVVPAPRRGIKAKGARRAEDRFARAVEAEMNRMAEEGWEFVRSDTLPCEQKPGWFSRPVTVFQTLLVFRRPLETQAESAPPVAAAAMPPPVVVAPLTLPAVAPPPPPVAAPAASRFTPAPPAPRPANDAAPVVMPPAPSLSLVADGGPLRVEPPEGEAEPNSRHAAE